MTDQAPELLPCPFCGNELYRSPRAHNPKAYCVAEDCYGRRMSVVNLDDPVCVAMWNTRPPSERPVAQAETERDATRYRRLRILGAAPYDTAQLKNGTVLRFTGLDDHIDADLSWVSSRGEAAPRPVAQMREACNERFLEQAHRDSDWIGLSASEKACYDWPDDTDLHKQCRAAYIAGATDYARPALTAERPEAAVAWRWRLPGGTNTWWYGDEKPLGLSSAWEIERGIFAIQHEEPGRETMTSVADDDGGL